MEKLNSVFMENLRYYLDLLIHGLLGIKKSPSAGCLGAGYFPAPEVLARVLKEDARPSGEDGAKPGGGSLGVSKLGR